jgi:V/A-type H+-transporting ATPase subunit F
MSDEADKKTALVSGSARIAVIGRRDTVVAFQAAGLAVFPVEPGLEVAGEVERIVAAGHQVVVFTEDLLPFLGGLLEKYRRAATPCLVALPFGGAHQSVARLKEVVKRAVGADVFGGPSD